MRFALFKEVPKRQRRKKRKLNDGAAARKGEDREGSEDTSEESDDEMDVPAERMSIPPPPPSTHNQLAQDPVWGDESQVVQMDTSQPETSALSGPGSDGKIRPERFV